MSLPAVSPGATPSITARSVSTRRAIVNKCSVPACQDSAAAGGAPSPFRPAAPARVSADARSRPPAATGPSMFAVKIPQDLPVGGGHFRIHGPREPFRDAPQRIGSRHHGFARVQSVRLPAVRNSRGRRPVSRCGPAAPSHPRSAATSPVAGFSGCDAVRSGSEKRTTTLGRAPSACSISCRRRGSTPMPATRIWPLGVSLRSDPQVRADVV